MSHERQAYPKKCAHTLFWLNRISPVPSRFIVITPALPVQQAKLPFVPRASCCFLEPAG